MDYVLEAYKRVKGEKASALRKEGWIPGCVYGKSVDPMNVKIKKTELERCLKHHAAKFELKVEGAKSLLVGLEEVQKGPLQDKLMHISFHAMKKNEVTTLSVEVEFTGKAKGQMEGGIIKENMHEITVKGYPADLPDKLIVDVSSLEIGDTIHVSDLIDHHKFEFLQEDHDKILASCGHPRVQKIEETVEVAEPAEVVAEVVGADKKEEAA